jgi:hypothetical protein
MKELGAESAAIQLDARVESAQHCLTWPDANRLEASVQDLWTSGIFIRGRYLKDMIADGAFK